MRTGASILPLHDINHAEAKFQAILDSVDVHITLINRKLDILWANRKSRKDFGEGIVGGPWVKTPPPAPAVPPKAETKAPAAPTPASPPPPPKAEAKVPAPPAAVVAAESGWIPASPIARRMARDAGVDLSKVSGSGPGGRILERDIEAYVAAQPQRMGGADVPTGAREFEDKDLSAIRKTIASRMLQSKAPIPHFTVTVEADMGAAQDLRSSLNAIDPNTEKLSVNHILIKAVALALKRNPDINAHYQDGKVRLFNRVYIGVAVALEDGLIVPVIRECETGRAWARSLVRPRV